MRFYDPKLANFLTMDPAHEYMNPYAYVGWNPVMRGDPTGRLAEGIGGLAGLEVAMALAARGGGCDNPGVASLVAASVAGGAGQFASAADENSLLTSIQSMVVADIVARVTSAAGEVPGSSFGEAVTQALNANQGVTVNLHSGDSVEAGL